MPTLNFFPIGTDTLWDEDGPTGSRGCPRTRTLWNSVRAATGSVRGIRPRRGRLVGWGKEGLVMLVFVAVALGDEEEERMV